MRTPKIEKFDFSEVNHDEFDKAVGVKVETIHELMDEVQDALHTTEKLSQFAQKLDEGFTKQEAIIALIAVIQQLR